jgi:hypothetical protein
MIKEFKVGDLVNYKGSTYKVEAITEDFLSGVSEYYLKNSEYEAHWAYPWEMEMIPVPAPDLEQPITMTKKVILHPEGYYTYTEVPEEPKWGRRKCCKKQNIEKKIILFKDCYVCTNCKKETDKDGFIN